MELRDVSMNTFIAELPEIVNFNNNVINDKFNEIYNESADALQKSLIKSNGIVDVYAGKFKNIQTDYLNITNPDWILDHIAKALNKIIIDDPSRGFNAELLRLYQNFSTTIANLTSTVNDLNNKVDQLTNEISVLKTHDVSVIYQTPDLSIEFPKQPE